MKTLPRDIIKPARYIGCEPNTIIKDLKGVKVRFALCYPDIYEVGMSYYGFFLLYELINNIEGIWCERCFAPWTDMEDYLRKHNIPLFTLESKTPLNRMDMVGFSLTYELNITNVLNMLKLSCIPLKASDRKGLPLVIGGGALMLNPLPFEDFFDLIVIGEAEEVLTHIMGLFKEIKGEDKRQIIEQISKIEGVYSPLFEKKSVKRLYIKDLDNSAHPIKPPIPVAGSIHNRLNVEISRGCGNGCRFCMAGFGYRPYRERSIERLKEIIDYGLKNTGYEEISFLSLSSGDYSHLYEAITYVKEAHKNTSISLPSLKIGSLSEEEIITIAGIARTGFTFALEASSETLRCRLNKDIALEKFLSQLHVLKRCGWRNIKIYLMVGFPWEKEDDLMTIKDFTKVFKGHGININLAISPFVPKPHTPFQWLAMDEEKSINEKIDFIKKLLKKEGVRIKYRDIKVSQIEGIISRGDKRLTNLFEYLAENHVRLEAWSEYFDFEKYRQWFEKKGIDMELLLKGKDPDVPLPWDFIDTGIDKSFLIKEFIRAEKGIYTENCYSHCASCGLTCVKNSDNFDREKNSEAIHTTPKVSETYIRMSFRYGKFGRAKYIGHLDTMNILLRAFKAWGIHIKTHGKFHPLPNITMSEALPVGIESAYEFIEIEASLNNIIDRALIKGINKMLPMGMKIYESYNTTIKNIKNDFAYLIVCDEDFVCEEAERLFKKNNKIFYCLKTKRIKDFLKYDKIKRIIKLQLRRINALRTHN
ncbi:MAG TPA: TIGR03960 family B12-binding radical SAM protein [Syntrophorhabdaceae bacterium]|nr:TIGR03960 family B12-binding radical SAM protein [Syntrophorhabdaceae bacterium]